jgi:nucleotide-binding universal stress UspA family protein
MKAGDLPIPPELDTPDMRAYLGTIGGSMNGPDPAREALIASLARRLDAAESQQIRVTGDPEEWRIHIAALGPDDVIVLSSKQKLSSAQMEKIKVDLVGLFGRKVLILDAGLELSIVAPTGEAAP